MFSEVSERAHCAPVCIVFGCAADNISLHLKNIYAEHELDETATTEEFSVVQKEGEREVARTVHCYSLEAIIAVGYRVNSERGTQFRQWATNILHQYIQKGFAIDDDRFKYGSRFSTRYFDDLLEEIRDIRASESIVWRRRKRTKSQFVPAQLST